MRKSQRFRKEQKQLRVNDLRRLGIGSGWVPLVQSDPRVIPPFNLLRSLNNPKIIPQITPVRVYAVAVLRTGGGVERRSIPLSAIVQGLFLAAKTLKSTETRGQEMAT
jgi:hypothetical protein